MKYAREMKVGALALVCMCVLFFGFHYLKGVNIFSPVYTYYGRFVSIPALTEQAPVFIRGYKVGQVDKIDYDFSRDSAFLVTISVDKHIALPHGVEMALVSPGILGGSAIELVLPDSAQPMAAYASGDYLPTHIVPGLMEKMQNELLSELTVTIRRVNEVVDQLGTQLDNDHIKNTLANADAITTDLKATSRDLKRVVATQVPAVLNHVDSLALNIDGIATSIAKADVVGKVDAAVNNVNGLISDVRSPEGTLGKLISDKSLYLNVNAAVKDADSLLTDIKARPRHYLYPLGAKEKKSKK